MPNQFALEQIELAELALAVDDTRAPEDPFKLPTALRTLLGRGWGLRGTGISKR